MDIDREFNASNLTLPDLLAEAERVRKQMTSHLRFDVQPKAQSLADHRDNDVVRLLDSTQFGLDLMQHWNQCCEETLRRIDSILNAS